MGSIIKVVKDTAKDLTKGVGDLIEGVVEKPIKKIGKETFDTLAGTTDEERRAMLSGDINFPEVTPEVTPEVVPDDTILASKERRRSAGKRSGGAGTIMEGYGVAYAKPSSKSPTGGAA